MYGHDHPGTAKATLRAVSFGQLRLNRVVAIACIAQPLNRCDFGAIARQEWNQALGQKIDKKFSMKNLTLSAFVIADAVTLD